MINETLQDPTNDDELIFAPEDDELNFAEENDGDENEEHQTEAWKVMLVDDDKNVHQVTELALRDFTFEGKPLQFISALSGE